MFYIRQGATHKVVVGPVVAVGDGFTPVTTLDVSTADEAEVILHDNGTVVDIAGYTWAAIATADGYYHLTLQSGISGTVGHMTVAINDDSLCLPVRADFTVLEEAVYDQLFAGSAPGAATTTALATAQADLDIITNSAGVVIADGLITAAKLGADAITADKIADNAIAAEHLADAAIDAATFAADTNVYTGLINVMVDAGGGPDDEYAVQWYKNGVALTSGVTSPAISVKAVAAGTTKLIDAQAMTADGSYAGAAFYNGSGAEKMDPGLSYIVVCTATIDTATRTAITIHGRDTAAA